MLKNTVGFRGDGVESHGGQIEEGGCFAVGGVEFQGGAEGFAHTAGAEKIQAGQLVQQQVDDKTQKEKTADNPDDLPRQVINSLQNDGGKKHG